MMNQGKMIMPPGLTSQYRVVESETCCQVEHELVEKIVPRTMRERFTPYFWGKPRNLLRRLFRLRWTPWVKEKTIVVQQVKSIEYFILKDNINHVIYVHPSQIQFFLDSCRRYNEILQPPTFSDLTEPPPYGGLNDY